MRRLYLVSTPIDNMEKILAKDNLELAIKRGKGLMRRAHDTFHDYQHARNVETNALTILKSEKINHLNPQLVSAAAYWHDVFKASRDKFYLLGNLSDGKRSSEITKRMLEGVLFKKSLDDLLLAVGSHDQVVKYALFPKSFSLLSSLLIEADMIDVVDVERWKRGICPKNMPYWRRIILSLFELFAIVFILPRVFNLSKSREIFRKKWLKFLRFFFLDEGYFWRLILNQV